MRDDPRWIVARFAGLDRDGKPFPKGARVFYYPATRTFLQGDAAEQAARDFHAAIADESLNRSL